MKLVENLLYSYCNLIHKSKLVKQDISGDSTLTLEEKASKYFWYEFKKSPRFDALFNLELKDKVVVEIGAGYGGYLYHLLKSGVKHVYGIDVDDERLKDAAKLVEANYKEKNFSFSSRGAEMMSHIEDNSVDLIVSDAVFEHILNRDRMFEEVNRILKPGGKLCFSTSPIWKTRNGGHLGRYIPIYWSHLIFSDKTIINVLNRQKTNHDFPNDALDNMIVIYKTIGKLTIAKLKKEIVNSGLKISSFRNITKSKIKKVLMNLPFGEEYFAGSIVVEVRK